MTQRGRIESVEVEVPSQIMRARCRSRVLEVARPKRLTNA